MIRLLVSCIFLLSLNAVANHDTLFWKFADSLEVGEVGKLEHDWGRESVRNLGIMKWTSPSGKELEIKIVTSYRQITQANGFQDASILALVKPSTSHLIKAYDFVKRKNLPIEIRDNKLVYHPEGMEEFEADLPSKFAERFCVVGHTCFDELHLHHGH